MKIEFLGMRSSTRKSGCSSCGGGRKGRETFHRQKTMTLPGGSTQHFVAGRIYELSDSDAAFLLQQSSREAVPYFKEVTEDGH